ncbi:MAG: Fic family protein [Parvibaculum sp.]
MNAGLSRLNELPISIRLIREIHAVLMAGVRGDNKQPGEVRTIQNWIGPENAPIKEATFVPPPPDVLGQALHDLEKFLNEENPNLPPLIRFGLAHAQFETVHPFLDGNGRMGRLLVTLLICRDDILTKPVLYISHYLKQHRARYYDLLQATRNDGDWEAWLKFFLTGISEVANEAAQTATRIVELRERHRTLATTNHGRAAANVLRLLEELYKIPITTTNRVSYQLGLSFAGATKLISRLEGEGVLTEITGRARNRVYRYEAYLSLFS